MRKKNLNGPQRSSSPLNDFLNPGVIFKILPNGQASLCPRAIFRVTSPSGSSDERDSLEGSEVENEVHLELSEKLRVKSELPLAREKQKVSHFKDQPSASSTSKSKRCFSCSARKTPYWREGWSEGVMLCNACGIRFHKYRKYCADCSCIAKKDEQGKLHCPKCLSKLS